MVFIFKIYKMFITDNSCNYIYYIYIYVQLLFKKTYQIWIISASLWTNSNTFNVVHVDVKELCHHLFCNYRLSLHSNPLWTIKEINLLLIYFSESTFIVPFSISMLTEKPILSYIEGNQNLLGCRMMEES